jgi:hypothetical protein
MAMSRRKRERCSIDQIDPEIFFSIFAGIEIEGAPRLCLLIQKVLHTAKCL